MRSLLFLLTGLCLATPVLAFEQTTMFVAGSSYVTSKVTSTPFENKLLGAARDDAASYIATDGRVRGARLEQALRWLRTQHPELAANDRELAEAILAQ
ncbi:conserverd hypothetical protein [Pseudomonas citronellolis]|jgi:uncharacterized protein (TIGR02448 family)|uniref:Holliday junction resolvase n=1 Tax=Pseudomonas citronellolis TaxID=53408 RepID=A0AAQ1HNI5_9PSED|nr:MULTISPECIES: DUF2388 domain-containing protein [Pseudomonas]KSW24882.1 Holliday junction resolvase [Pseudomonas sp. ADP]MCP1604693.1 uncharacterized protein (TIGR02448 family) [Pseudomonas citronellolis]MCP1655516.1 uncharacterized protein (TIGR02448 family) [Pseudomonas citronellolis]MCP1722140.1 uncharacterized protein (TIGR02448 family) [Pseudomonas citronellolis]OBP08418.1 Holliday junction resolvase [Pseudomonas sp. EGD-AKN5]